MRISILILTLLFTFSPATLAYDNLRAIPMTDQGGSEVDEPFGVTPYSRPQDGGAYMGRMPTFDGNIEYNDPSTINAKCKWGQAPFAIFYLTYLLPNSYIPKKFSKQKNMQKI